MQRWRIGYSGWRSLAFAGVLAVAGGSAFAARIAVVTDGGRAVGQAIDVAQAQASGAGAKLQFVERGGIDKILAEQKLSLSGVVSAQQAVQAGVLLSADLLAIVETDAAQSQATGVIIFDAHTGERYVDKGLEGGGEKIATTLADAFTQAVRKSELPVGKRRPVCLLTVRNVDLPPSDDPFCDAVAALMERRLLASPDVVLMERQRLSDLRKEHELPTKNVEVSRLISSVTLLEMQVARDGDGKVRATCVLTDGQGKRADAAPTAVGTTDRADALADALAAGIAKALSVPPPGPADDVAARRAEAARFYREAQFWWAQRDYQRPVAALEAAAALDPDNRLMQVELARGLVLYGITRIENVLDNRSSSELYYKPDTSRLQMFLRRAVSSADVSASLETMQDALRVLMTSHGKSTNPEIEKTTDVVLKMLMGYLQAIGREQESASAATWGHPAAWSSAENLEAVRRIRLQYFAYQRRRQGAPALADATDWNSANLASAALQDMLSSDDFYTTATRREVLRELQENLADWAVLFQRVPPTGSPAIRGIAQLLEPQRLEKEITQVPAPSGGHIPLSGQDKLSLVEIYDLLAKTHDAACVATSDEGREWLKDVIAKAALAKQRPVMQIPRRRPRLLVAGHGGTPLPEAATAPAAPAATAPAPEIFWKQEALVLDLSGNKPGEPRTIYHPVVYQNHIYVAAAKPTDGRGPGTAVLLDIDLAHLPTVLHATLPVRHDGRIADSWSTQARGSVADGYYVLVDHRHATVELFPLDGSPPIELNAARGFDFPKVDTATVVAGKVYAAGLNLGMLIEYDLATRKTRTLAASKRTDVQSPFDNLPPMRIPFMVPDPARDRIVFFAWAPGWPKGLSGLWEYNVKTEKFKGLKLWDTVVPSAAPFQEIGREGGAGPVIKGRFCWEARGHHEIFNLQTNQLEPDPTPAFGVGVPGWAAGSAAVAITDHYLWKLRGRIPLSGSPIQEFPDLVTTEQGFPAVHGCFPIDDNRMIAYDHSRIWLLSPPEKGSAALSTMEKKTPLHRLPPPISPPEGGELPWSKAQVLYDHIRDNAKLETYTSPRVVGDSVYVLGMGHDVPKELRPRNGGSEETQMGFAQLLRYPLDGGAVKPLAKLPVGGVSEERRPDERFTSSSEFPAVVALDEHNYYAGMRDDRCVVVFPLDGSPARKITLDFQSTHLAVLDGMLYVSFYPAVRNENAIIARLDPVTGKDETLLAATTNSTRRRSPEILNLWSDAPRHRILYLARSVKSDPKVDGIWELIPATGKKRLVLPLFMAMGHNERFTSSFFVWSAKNSDGRILVAGYRGSFAFDPATDTAQTLCREHPFQDPLATGPTDPNGPHPAPSGNDLLNGRVFPDWPFAIGDSYLWNSFGRVSLDGRVYEKFPALRSGPQFGVNELQFFAGGKKLLVSDLYGAWILDLNP